MSTPTGDNAFLHELELDVRPNFRSSDLNVVFYQWLDHRFQF